MATKWGEERGTMLAIHATRDVVEQVISKVGGGELEVACYNAVASQVVGSASAVARAEAVLAGEAQFGSVRSQRVDVTHGFHSKFTEPLLDELSQHTRQPVYFVDAVRRIEARLGPRCLWLEAGTDSPIVPMVVGLLINSSDACIPDHVFVATGLDSATLSQACDFAATDSWTVYAVFRSTSDTTATGDVFVMACDDTVALTVMDVAFTRLPIATLEKLLDTANSTPASRKDAALPKHYAPQKHATTAVPSRHAVPDLVAADEYPAHNYSESEGSVPPPPSEQDDSSLRKTIAMYTDVSIDSIAAQATMADLGVDSLAAVEFEEDLRSQSGKDIESADLLASTLNVLSQLVLTSVSKSQSKTKSTKAHVVQMDPLLQVRAAASSAGRQRLLEIVSDACGAPPADIKDSHTLRDLGADSLASVELSSDLENAFSVQIDENDLHLDSTVAEIIKYLGFGNESEQSTPSMQTPTPISISISISTQATHSHSQTSAPAPQGEPNAIRQRVAQIISDACGALAEDINGNDLLRDLGVDSLSAMELKNELEDEFNVELDDDLLDLSVSETLKSCGGVLINFGNASTISSSTTASRPPTSKPANSNLPKVPTDLASPFDSLVISEKDYAAKARKCGFLDFGANVSSRQDELMLAYIVGALVELGVDLRKMKEGTPLPPFAYRSKHAYDRQIQRIWVILGKHGLVNAAGTSRHVRGATKCPQSTSKDLLGRMRQDFPAYNCEFSLRNLTESQLGQCLAGKQDPIALMFKTHDAQAVMEDFYLNSSMLATTTEMLVGTIVDAVSRSKIHNLVNILEIGAGYKLGRPVNYTFTDISPTLVGRALKVFSDQYPWLHFQTWNMEQTPPLALCTTGPFDVIIGTNSVHATQDRSECGSEHTKTTHSLMIHRGGHVTLSRKAVRPAQTNFLLENGVLPISIDHRLCPEVNIIDGPIADTLDAYKWMTTALPDLARAKSIVVDPQQVVVIGWSTAGHFAITTAWTAKSAVARLPRAILSFYFPRLRAW
ncbi:hypothetical protein COCVIDRAFT_20004 [Bipolaris victoriae FI3]|uniref:Carrier domain-containing protein n=1 Tax=Bipolaris victoriae (strain FI3) TaxID=930091 RepID=W7E8G2_BIPV3|nr:hypothetical protein COCVIDRAFT_20004 [Bipolaris victoriae FI3]